MSRTAKQLAALFLLTLVVCALAWRLWPDGGQARRQQRNHELLQAVIQNHLADAARLLDEGADPNMQQPAFSLSKKAEIYYFGVSRRIKTPNWRHLDDMNPRWSVLQIAAMHGNADMINALLSKGADVGYRDRQGGTALTWVGGVKSNPAVVSASARKYPRVVALLRAAEARKVRP